MPLPARRRRVLAVSFAALLAVLGIVAAVGLAAEPLPGMPPVVDPANLYSETQAGRMSPALSASAYAHTHAHTPADAPTQSLQRNPGRSHEHRGGGGAAAGIRLEPHVQ